MARTPRRTKSGRKSLKKKARSGAKRKRKAAPRSKTARRIKSGRKEQKKKALRGAELRREAPPGSVRAEVMEAVPSPVISPRAVPDDNARRVAVVNCVNGALDANRPGWNSDGNGNSRIMGKDFHYDAHSMPAFLGVVSRCLAPTYTLTIDSTLVQACVSATVANLKFLVFNTTK